MAGVFHKGGQVFVTMRLWGGSVNPTIRTSLSHSLRKPARALAACIAGLLTTVAFAAPTLPTVSIGSSNANTLFAKAGDTVTVTFTASEPIQPPTVTLLGASATVTNTAGNTWSATAMVTGATTEGAAAFSITAADLLGDTAAPVTATTNGSSVTVDRTAPTLTLPSNLTRGATTATGAAVTYTASAADAGGSGIQTSNFTPASGSTFNLGTTTVNASATDKAGNSAAGSFNVTVNPGVSILAASVVEGDSGTSTLNLQVRRTDTTTGFTVNYAVTGGTATAGTDFATLAPGTLTFAPGGPAIQNISITINGDTTVESAETITVGLSGLVNTTGTTTIAAASASGSISNDDTIPLVYPATNTVVSSVKGSIALAGAEIPAFDPASKRAFASSNTGIQVVDLTNPAAPAFIGTITPASMGVPGLTSNDITSVAVRKGTGGNPSVLAAAIINTTKTSPGHVVFLDAATGTLLGSAQVGAVPDNLTFSPDGTKVLVANEGELDGTAADVAADTTPGGVSIIDVSAGFAAPTVQTAGFAAFDSQIPALKAAGVRIFNNGTTDALPSVDFEAEYIAISPDGTTAMVTLQEANAVGILDIATATFTAVQPLGKKDFSPLRVDFSDRDGPGAVALINPTVGNPVFGLYMPDAIAAYSAGGQTYYVTANEGDDRNDFVTPDESTTVGAAGYTLDPTVFPNAAALKNNAMLGRLTVSNAPGLRGDTDNDGDVDEILSYGGRSFSILDAAGNLVFDSGDMIDLIVASQHFANLDDGRSDNKGSEPEGVTIAKLGGRTYAFIGLERSHMVLMFDVTNPAAVVYTTAFKNTGDLNPEGLIVVPAQDSPNGKPLLITTNEVSNTLTIFEMQSPGNAAPVVTVPASPIIVADAGGIGRTVTFAASANDAEDGALTPVLSQASGSLFPPGDTTVTASATDSFGTTTTQSFVVRVVAPAAAQAAGWDFAGVDDGLLAQFKFTKGLQGTGSAILDGVSYKGALSLSSAGVATGTWYAKTGSVPVSVTLGLDAQGNAALTATIAGRTVVLGRAGYRTANPAPASIAGRYTFILPAASLAGSPVLPGGSGYGLVEVRADGSVRVKGKLADNTAYTASTRVTQSGGIPVFAALYPSGATRGWWSSQVTLDRNATDDLAGAIDWHKPAQSSGLYPAAADFTGSLIGSRYEPGVGLPAPLAAVPATLTVPIGVTTFTGTGTPVIPTGRLSKFRLNGVNLAQRSSLDTLTGHLSGYGTGIRGFNTVILQKQGEILGFGVNAAGTASGEASLQQ